jgi:hypothetical protein
VSDPSQAEPSEVVIIATKLGDTEPAAKDLKPVLREGAIIISLQNGIVGPDIIAAALPGAHVVPGLARISSHIAQPDVIEHKAQAGRIEFGDPDGRANPHLRAFHQACKDAGIDAVLASDIRYNVWLKFASLAPSSGLMTRVCVCRFPRAFFIVRAEKFLKLRTESTKLEKAKCVRVCSSLPPIAEDEHPDHERRIDRRTAEVGVVGCQRGAHPGQIQHGSDLASSVLSRNSFIKAERIEQLPLVTVEPSHHRSPPMPSPHRR